MITEFHLPETAVLEVTYECNHACLFCSCPWYANPALKQPELATDEWKQIIDQYAGKGVKNFSFTGGEAILRKDIKTLLRYAASRGHVVLLSNGKAMTDDILRLCADLQIHLSISLPGLSSFAKLTCGGRTSQDVLKLFYRAAHWGLKPTAAIAVTKQNFHELYETIAMALLSGAETILLNRFLPGGRGLQYRNELELTLDQIRQIPDIAEEVLAKANRYGHIGTELPLCIADPSKYKHIQFGTFCGAAKTFFVTGPSGMIRVCNHSPTELVLWRDVDKLANHPYWRRFKSSDYLPEQCSSCSRQDQCDAGCREAAHVLFGDISAIDPMLQTKGNL